MEVRDDRRRIDIVPGIPVNSFSCCDGGLRLVSETFTRRRFDVDRHIRQSYGIFKGGRELREITLKFDAPYMARFVGGTFWHPEQRGESTPDGGLRLTIPVADFTEITMRILSFGRHVEVPGPGRAAAAGGGGD